MKIEYLDLRSETRLEAYADTVVLEKELQSQNRQEKYTGKTTAWCITVSVFPLPNGFCGIPQLE